MRNKLNNDMNLIKKYLSTEDLIDNYITKNILKIIKNKKSFEFIKKNIFLLGVVNKNNKNSLLILLENGKYQIINELIYFNFQILNYKNADESNLLKNLLGYNYFYDYINDYIQKFDYHFVIKLLTSLNKNGKNFIDNLIMLISIKNNNVNNEYVSKLFIIIKSIYMLDCEKYTLIITKLCKMIKNEKYLQYIINLLEINNFDIYPDKSMLNCIDYLIINNHLKMLDNLLDKINHIEFINIDDSLIFNLIENSEINIKTKSNLILKILSKSNISKLKNRKNQNIFYFLIQNFKIELNVIIKFFDYINIYEQDIDGITLFDIINQLYPKKDLILMKLNNSQQITLYQNKFELINSCLNLKNKLIKSNIGIFTANIIHNMLYTIIILESNQKYLTLPYSFQTYENIKEQEKLMILSNNEKNILSYLKIYFNNFNIWLPHLIIWKNKNNYWVDSNLINFIKQKQNTFHFIYIKLSVYLMDNNQTRHSNCIIIDNIKKIVERFEPYGEMIFMNSNDINKMITENIAKPLGYKFIFIQPYPGFQSRSDEFAKYNKTYGDPMGFCLAWTFLYIYIKMELFKLNSDINPIDFINWYIINKFEKDFDIDINLNKTNKYILFIRYYAMYLDKQKNILIKKYNLDPGFIYQSDLEVNYHNQLINNINFNLEKIIKNQNN